MLGGRTKVQTISGSRSDYASVANESLSRRLVKKRLYIRDHYWPCSLEASILSPSRPLANPLSPPQRLNVVKLGKLLRRENKEKIGKRFSCESGVNYRLDT